MKRTNTRRHEVPSNASGWGHKHGNSKWNGDTEDSCIFTDPEINPYTTH